MTPSDFERVQRALMLSQAAYDFSKIPVGPEWSAPTFILDHGFCASWNGTLFVAFRGTRDLHDWLSDIDSDPNDLGIHSGFYNLYAALQPAMVEAMSGFPYMPVEFCGHSLGSALAVIAAYSTPGARSITFASPRIFSAARAQTLPQEGLRIANERDIVPHLPGRGGFWRWEHRAKAYRFKGSSFELAHAHSLDESYAPALDGTLEGPLDLA